MQKTTHEYTTVRRFHNQLCGNQLEMVPGGSLLNCCFPWTTPSLHELQVHDKPPNSQHQHMELSMGHGHILGLHCKIDFAPK